MTTTERTFHVDIRRKVVVEELRGDLHIEVARFLCLHHNDATRPLPPDSDIEILVPVEDIPIDCVRFGAAPAPVPDLDIIRARLNAGESLSFARLAAHPNAGAAR